MLLSVIETLIIVFIQALMTAVFLGAVFIPLLKEIYKKLEGWRENWNNSLF